MTWWRLCCNLLFNMICYCWFISIVLCFDLIYCHLWWANLLRMIAFKMPQIRRLWPKTFCCLFCQINWIRWVLYQVFQAIKMKQQKKTDLDFTIGWPFPRNFIYVSKSGSNEFNILIQYILWSFFGYVLSILVMLNVIFARWNISPEIILHIL